MCIVLPRCGLIHWPAATYEWVLLMSIFCKLLCNIVYAILYFFSGSRHCSCPYWNSVCLCVLFNSQPGLLLIRYIQKVSLHSCLRMSISHRTWGAQISWYLQAISIAVIPTNCNFHFLALQRERYLSMMYTVRYNVSGISSNFRCTCKI